MDRIAANLARVHAAIARAAASAARRTEEIKLIAVSKTQSTEVIESAVGAGQSVFGESTVQEALPKISHFHRRRLEWHFVGHLQSNKVKFIPGNFLWMHSLDSVTLAQRLSRLAQDKNVIVNTLIAINVTRDPKKHGVAPDRLFLLLDQLSKENLPGIELRGLMAIGPYPAVETETRAAFAALRALRDDAVRRFTLPGFTELSMGMTGDYTEGIKEGATMIRLGTAIFGARDYSK